MIRIVYTDGGNVCHMCGPVYRYYTIELLSTHTHRHTHIHTYTHTHTHIYIYIYTYTHIYTHSFTLDLYNNRTADSVSAGQYEHVFRHPHTCVTPINTPPDRYCVRRVTAYEEFRKRIVINNRECLKLKRSKDKKFICCCLSLLYLSRHLVLFCLRLLVKNYTRVL